MSFHAIDITDFTLALLRRGPTLRMTMNYPFDEFIRHCMDYSTVRQYEHIELDGEQIEVGPDADGIEGTVLRVFDYMRQLYPDSDEAREKASVFCTIQSFLAQHAQEFDRGTLAVHGEHQGLVSEHLVRAVHHFFTTKPMGEWNSIKPDAVIALAERFESEKSGTS